MLIYYWSYLILPNVFANGILVCLQCLQQLLSFLCFLTWDLYSLQNCCQQYRNEDTQWPQLFLSTKLTNVFYDSKWFAYHAAVWTYWHNRNFLRKFIRLQSYSSKFAMFLHLASPTNFRYVILECCPNLNTIVLTN